MFEPLKERTRHTCEPDIRGGPTVRGGLSLVTQHNLVATSLFRPQMESISYPESSGSLVSGVVARRDSGIMEFLSHESSFSSPEPLGFTHHYEWLWLQPKIRIFSLANETQCALGIKLRSTAHFRRVINCNVVDFKNQRVYKRTCFSFEHFEREEFISEENMLSL